MIALVPEILFTMGGVCAGLALALLILFLIFSKHWPSDL